MKTELIANPPQEMRFNKLEGERFDFGLAPNQSTLYLPYSSLYYDVQSQIYWIYFVLITPGKPNKFYRGWSYDLHFSFMNIEEVQAKYGAIIKLPSGEWLNSWHFIENGVFITQMARSADGITFYPYSTNPVIKAGEDRSFYLGEYGRLWMFIRNDRPRNERRRQSVCYSDDGGYTWSPKQICLEIPDSKYNDPNSIFHRCQIYSMSVTKYNNIFYASVNVFNDNTDQVSIKIAKSTNLYTWEWVNLGMDVIPQLLDNQNYGALCTYKDPGVNDVPERLIMLVQTCPSKHSDPGIFRLNLFELSS